jgi:hypothetical protein
VSRKIDRGVMAEVRAKNHLANTEGKCWTSVGKGNQVVAHLANIQHWAARTFKPVPTMCDGEENRCHVIWHSSDFFSTF